MAIISKINNIGFSLIAEINNTAKANIAKLSGTETPSSALLLDTYTGSAAAYSVRHINTLYTGDCMRVREAGGNTETDIGFDSNGDLDTAAIAAHCGSSIGYVTKWYSQATSGTTGAGNDLTQTTTSQQPRIYDGSSVYTDNGIAAVELPNVSNGRIGFDLQSPIRTSFGPSSVISVMHVDQRFSSGYQRIASLYRAQQPVWGSTGGDASYGKLAVGNSSTTSNRFVRYNTMPNRLDQKVWATIYDGSTRTSGNAPDVKLYENGVVNTGQATGTAGFFVPGFSNNSIGYRNQNNSQGLDGTFQEVILFASDESSNISGISTNMETYFSIT